MKSTVDKVYTCGIDDSVKQIDMESNSYTGLDIKLGCQPRGMDIYKEQGIIITSTVNDVTVIKDGRVQSNLKVNYEPSCVAASLDGDIAVGGTTDNTVHVYQLNGTTLSPKSELQHLGPITDCSYSPDNKYLVACDTNRKVILYSVPEYKVSFFLVFVFVVVLMKLLFLFGFFCFSLTD